MALNDQGLGYVPPPDEIIINPDGTLNPFSVRALQETISNLIANFNGSISFGDGSQGSKVGNLNAVYAKIVTPAVANQEFSLKHELGRIPVGFDISMKDKSGTVFASRLQSWTASVVYLKCSTATTSITVRLY